MKKWLAAVVLVIASVAVTAVPASASHSWAGYHWARTANPFTIQLGDNVSSAWDSYLSTASADWSKSTVLRAPVSAGRSTGRCRATSGRVEVCSGSYGNNGWLGLASISVTGGTHITQGTVKVNDTYFASATYNNPNERAHVMCQEVGHTFGLDHTSTDGSSQNTCMDYFSNTGANATSTASTKPNQHDYDELATIYSHLDSTSTVGAFGAAAAPDWTPAAWRSSVYVDRQPNGDLLVTFVYWANPLHL